MREIVVAVKQAYGRLICSRKIAQCFQRSIVQPISKNGRGITFRGKAY